VLPIVIFAKAINYLFQNENYLLNYHNDCMWIMFHDDAESSLRFHDILKNQGIKKETDWEQYDKAMRDSLEFTREKFPGFVASLDSKDWQSDSVYWNDR